MQQFMQTLELGQHGGGTLTRLRLFLAVDADLDDGAEHIGLFLIERLFTATAEHHHSGQ